MPGASSARRSRRRRQRRERPPRRRFGPFLTPHVPPHYQDTCSATVPDTAWPPPISGGSHVWWVERSASIEHRAGVDQSTIGSRRARRRSQDLHAAEWRSLGWSGQGGIAVGGRLLN